MGGVNRLAAVGRRAFAALAVGCALAVAGVAPARAQDITARLSASRVSVPEAFTLTVTVGGGRLQGEPVFDLPDGIELLRRNRAQNFSWVNGRATTEVQFLYELVARAAGRYEIGPIEVNLAERRFRSGVLTLDAVVGPASLGSGGGGGDAASLLVDVIPREPWVGQATTLRTRLVQRATFSEDPQYIPPSATGFWAEPSSTPESYYATSGGERVLVTETRARLFPLAAGDATIGEAVAQVVVGDGGDPSGWPFGRGREPLVLRSKPLTVHVRPLPAGAPAGFGGAVGEFVARWGVDRTRTTLDVPVLVTLDVRGVGNLPLVRAPELVLEGFEVFSSTSEDSVAAPGGPGLGRRRFRWTALARSTGAPVIALPGFSWFDPARGEYRSQSAVTIPVQVEPAPPAVAGAGGGARGAWTSGSAADGARVARPWLFALAGLAGAAALVLLRRARAPVPRAPERAQALEWLRAIGTARGPDFWGAAERAGAWLAARGERVEGLEARIASARYGGVRLDDDDTVRRQLVERLSRAMPPAPPRAALTAAAASVFVVALVAVVALGWSPAPAVPGRSLGAADASARRGDATAARETWESAWRAGLRTPALAARLAASALEAGDVATASAWVLRGRHLEGRDRVLADAEARVREAGGLIGARIDGLPVRRLEWAVLALSLGLAAGIVAARRRVAVTLAALAVLAGAVPAIEAFMRRDVREAIVREARMVGDEGLELQPGQVVRITGTAGAGDVAIEIARGTRARVPATAVIEVEPAGAGGGAR